MKLINRRLELTNNHEFIFLWYVLGIRVCKRIVDIKKFCKCKYHDVEKNCKSILIVKTDSIGDYVLMRNFLQIIKNSKKYKNAKITLILSSAMRGIAEALDKNIVDKIFYVPHPFWFKSDYIKLKHLKKLFANGLDTSFDTVLFPNVNVRNFVVFNNMLVHTINADEYIGRIGDLDHGNINDMSKLSYLTSVFPDYDAKETFEFFNNRDFFSYVLDEQIKLPMHHIDMQKQKSMDGIVIAPGAQDAHRCWHINNIVSLVKELKKNSNIILVGGKAEQDCIDKINRLSGNSCCVMIGKPMQEVLNVINNAKLFIGMDSGLFHCAVSLKTKAICISSGISYYRFVQYPKSSNYRIVFAPETAKILPGFGSIQSVKPQMVINTVKLLLKDKG